MTLFPVRYEQMSLGQLREYMADQIKNDTNFYFFKPITFIGLIIRIWMIDSLQEKKWKKMVAWHMHLTMGDSSWNLETLVHCMCDTGRSSGWRVSLPYGSVGLSIFLVSCVYWNVSQNSLELICFWEWRESSKSV